MLQKPLFNLYNEGTDIGLSEIASYLKTLGIDVNIKGSLIEPNEETALAFAKSRVVSETAEIENQPLKAEIEYEKKHLTLKEKSSFIYDGFRLQGIFRKHIPKEETSLAFCNIIFVSLLLATFEDRRYHLRVGVYGFPSIISIPGIISAPAKPREYYIKKGLGVNEQELKNEFEARFIGEGSPYIPEILKGYTLQAIFFHLTGFPFCKDKDCRLYNSHWQEEMINAQLTSGRLCEEHQSIHHLSLFCNRGRLHPL